MKVVTLEQAQIENLPRYFTGKPCRKGHLSERRTSNQKCIQCATDYQKQKMRADPDYAQRQRELTKRSAERHRKSQDPEQRREKDRAKYHANIEEHRAKAREKQRLRRQKLEYRIKSNMSYYLWRFIKKGRDGTSQILMDRCGYTIPELMVWLERQFLDGMTWENYGRDGWHIDHIIPASTFDQSDPVEFRACWALTNLRPMWAKDNKIKNNKVLFLL